MYLNSIKCKNMHILYISASWIPSKNANAVHVMKMCQAFKHNGHHVTLFCAKGADMQQADIFYQYGIRDSFTLCFVPRANIKILWNIFYTIGILRKFRTVQQPDLIYGRYAFALLLLSYLNSNIPLAYEAHALPTGKINLLIERLLFKRPGFKKLITISSALQQDYLDAADDTLPVDVAHDGADLQELPEAPPRPKQDGLNICYIGKLSAGKGLTLIAKLSHICTAHQFHIFGGDQNDIKKWTQYCAKNVHFHGHVAHGELSQKISDMDVMLAPLQRVNIIDKGYDIGKWTSPLKIFEYMNSGRPIICSDIPVLHEIIEPDVNGLMASPTDAQDWAYKINMLYQDPDLGNRLAKKARFDLETKYTWKKRANAILQSLA